MLYGRKYYVFASRSDFLYLPFFARVEIADQIVANPYAVKPVGVVQRTRIFNGLGKFVLNFGKVGLYLLYAFPGCCFVKLFRKQNFLFRLAV